ncbi:hypothetical protein CHH27_21920 [Labrenzia sp. VG12]|nr:hypothetical protein CHH27_21920 [Labrenzia sp. VG12]
MALYSSAILSILIFALARVRTMGRTEDWLSALVIGLGITASGYHWYLLSSQAQLLGRSFVQFFAAHLTLSCLISLAVYSAGIWFRKRAMNTKEI